MKSGFIALSFLFLFSCSEDNQTTERSVVKSDTVPIEIAKKDTFPEILKPQMIARGSEPGWYAEFFWDYVTLSLDYDQIKLKLQHDFSKLDVKEFKTEINANGSASDKVEIQIKQEACTEEASGEKRERSILIRYKGKEYKGCATVEL